MVKLHGFCRYFWNLEEKKFYQVILKKKKKKEFNDGNGSLTKCINPVWFSVQKNENMLVFIYCKIKEVDG